MAFYTAMIKFWYTSTHLSVISPEGESRYQRSLPNISTLITGHKQIQASGASLDQKDWGLTTERI